MAGRLHFSWPLGLALNEEQTPQIVENNKNQGAKNGLEGLFLRPRQVRYQTALRPGAFDRK
jgi:hypothetical protein